MYNIKNKLRLAIAFIITSSLLTLSMASFAMDKTDTQEYAQGLSEEHLTNLKKSFERNPGALADDKQALKNISSQQIAELLEHKDTSHYSFLHIVKLTGQDLGNDLLGTEIKNLSVMTLVNKTLQPIPFQIDEMDITGLALMPKVRTHDIDGTEFILDKHDELVFMYRDAGFENYNQAKNTLKEGKVLKEIKLTFPGRKDRFAYLIENNAQRNPTKYIDLDIEKGALNSTYYESLWNPKNITDLYSVKPKVGPNQGKNIIDTIYFEVSAGLFNKNVRVTLNSKKNFLAKVADTKSGPIRVTALIKGRTKLIGIPSPSPYYMGVVFGEQSVGMKSRSTPEGYKYAKYITTILKEPKIYVSADFQNMKGAKISFDSIYDENNIPIADGKMSEIEKQVNKERLPGDWFWFESGHGWSFFLSNNLPIIEGGLFDAFLEGISFHMVYEDDETSITDYERFPGGEPRVGVRVEGLPKIGLEMVSTMSKIPWEDVESFQDVVTFIIEQANSRKMNKLNEIISEVLIQERSSGRIKDNSELANAFIADFSLVGLKGVEPEKLNQAITMSVMNLKSFEEFDIGKVLTNLRTAFSELKIDSSLIHYAPKDNVLWLPDSVEGLGPDGFRKQVNNPPQFSIKAM